MTRTGFLVAGPGLGAEFMQADRIGPAGQHM